MRKLRRIIKRKIVDYQYKTKDDNTIFEKITTIMLKIFKSKHYKRILKVIKWISFIIILSYLPMIVTFILLGIFILFIFITRIISFFTWISGMKITGLMNYFNTITFGFKGTGKDLLMQNTIIHLFKGKFKRQLRKLHKQHDNDYNGRLIDIQYIQYLSFNNNDDNFISYIKYLDKYPKNYLSNMDYGYGARIVSFKEFELGTNDFKALIDNRVQILAKIKEFEGLNYYGSDSGILLPSTEDTYLNKKYTTFPVMSALSRQLYDMCFNFNTQSLSRIWIKFREQQDYYIKAVKTIPPRSKFLKYLYFKLPYFKKRLFVTVITYNKFESAKLGIMPFNKNGILSRGDTIHTSTPEAMRKEFISMNGNIKKRTISIKIKNIKYDTRYFHQVMFGTPYIKEV